MGAVLARVKAHAVHLKPLNEYLGDFEVARDYRIKTDARCHASIYMQGFCESSHGLSDTLLSVLPIRADEIAESVYASMSQGSRDQAVLERLLAVG